jgi:hypothetical protein
VLPISNLPDYSQKYEINKDSNYDKFWEYYRNRTNHRKHKQIVYHSKRKSEPTNPVVRSTSRIRTECRIRCLAFKNTF